MFGGQEQKLHAAHVGGKGQGHVQGLARCAPTGGIAVKAEHHGIAETKQFLHMFGGAGGAQGGHGMAKAPLGQGHHVHIAFGHQHIARFAQRLARLEQTVEFAPLAEHRGFWRVQVLGGALAEHASAKANALAFDVADGEHDAVAKTVVALVFAAIFGVVDHQTTVDQQGVLVVGKHAGQAAPAFRRVAQAISFSDFPRQATALEVLTSRR